LVIQPLSTLDQSEVSIGHPCLGVQPGRFLEAQKVVAILGYNFASETMSDGPAYKWSFHFNPRNHQSPPIQILEVPTLVDLPESGNHLCIKLGQLNPTETNDELQQRLDEEGIKARIVPAGKGKFMLVIPTVFQQDIELEYVLVDRP
jgi:hypothetical protein